MINIEYLKSWDSLKPMFDDLLGMDINSKEDLIKFLKKFDRINAEISEEYGWRYINMTRDTSNKQYTEDYQKYVSEVIPKVEEFNNKLNNKILDSEFISLIENQPGYDLLVKGLRVDKEIFRIENIELNKQESLLAQEYNQIIASMSIKYQDKEITLQEAATYLESSDRVIRKEIYEKIEKSRLSQKERLEEIFSKLVTIRHQIARNSNFISFTDYSFKKLKRYDYKIQDCKVFHQSVKSEIMPLVETIVQERKNKLGYSQLKPYDLKVDPSLKPALKPFDNIDELIETTIKVFGKLNPYYSKCLEKMRDNGHLDLMSRKNKAPGGYNYPLDITKMPFIFMNATHTFDDMVTLLHEGGHAIHSFLTNDKELNSFKHAPTEASELASMSMELLSMKHWDLFFNDKDDLKRAKMLLLERIITLVPWVACIDKFQHWIYANPEHSVDQRKKEWRKIFDEFNDHIVDWSGYEEAKEYLWHKQLHLFEVPFYYIEYAFSQMGALGIWKNSFDNEKQSLEDYEKGLSLGHTASLPDIFKTAGVSFNFNKENIKNIFSFAMDQYKKISEK